jgi:hypothetical protein
MGITYKSKLRFLGICITENIEWEAQVQSLSSKVSKISYIIKSLKEIMSPYVIRSIYYTNFQSCLRCIILWGGVDNESENILELQKKVIKIISGVSNTSYRQIFINYKILMVASLYVLKMIYCIKKDKDSLAQNVHSHNYDTQKTWIFIHSSAIQSSSGKAW